jgi:hypothetical protein
LINTIILLVVFFVFLLAIFSNLSSRINKLKEKIRVLRRDFDCLEYNCDAEYSKMRDIVNKTNTSINDRRNKTDRNKQVDKDTMIKKIKTLDATIIFIRPVLLMIITIM